MDAEVLGETVLSCLLDSGSPYSFIRPSLLSKVMSACSGKSQISFSAISGSHRFAIDTAYEITFLISSVEFKLCFDLFEESNFPILLGTVFFVRK